MGGAHVGPPAPLQNRFGPAEQQAPGRATAPTLHHLPISSKKFPKLGDSFPVLRRLGEDKEEEQDKETHQERPSVPHLWRAFPRCCSCSSLTSTDVVILGPPGLLTANSGSLLTRRSSCGERCSDARQNSAMDERETSETSAQDGRVLWTGSQAGGEGHVHQSIGDHRPITARVCPVSADQRTSLAPWLRPPRTGPADWPVGFIYQNKVAAFFIPWTGPMSPGPSCRQSQDCWWRRCESRWWPKLPHHPEFQRWVVIAVLILPAMLWWRAGPAAAPRLT